MEKRQTHPNKSLWNMKGKAIKRSGTSVKNLPTRLTVKHAQRNAMEITATDQALTWNHHIPFSVREARQMQLPRRHEASISGSYSIRKPKDLRVIKLEAKKSLRMYNQKLRSPKQARQNSTSTNCNFHFIILSY